MKFKKKSLKIISTTIVYEKRNKSLAEKLRKKIKFIQKLHLNGTKVQERNVHIH